MRKALTAAAAVLATGAAVALTATPAHAASYIMYTDEGNNSGYVTFRATGDVVKVCDGGGSRGGYGSGSRT